MYRKTSNVGRSSGLVACWLGFTVAFSAHAQGNIYAEDFENVGSVSGGAGPDGLIAAGWEFSVQSSNFGGEVWHEGPEPGIFYPDFPAYEGSHYLMIGNQIVQGAGDAGSAWAVLPNVPGMQAGNQLKFQLRANPNYLDVVQVRYSPTGGTNIGGGPGDVGDFTELLFEEDLRVPCEFKFPCPMSEEWYFQQITVPGSGRLAFRYYIPEHANGGSGSHVAIDALAIGSGVSEPPYPAAGETVHWDLAGSPYFIPDDRTIVAGGTVIVDAGVTVDIEDEKELLVRGELRVDGVDGQPAFFTAPSQAARIAVNEGGLMTLNHADIACHINVAAGNIFGSPAGQLIANNTFFHGIAVLSGTLQGNARAILVFHDCAFEGVQVFNSHCQADIRNTTFVDAGQSGVLLNGYLYLDNVHLDNSQLHIGAPRGLQPMYLNNITSINYPQGGGFLLSRAQNFLLGPDNVLQNNLYPIEFGVDLAGLLPGSVVPASGNTNNYVTDNGEDFDPGGNIVWAPIGIPYVVEEWRFSPATQILPGVTVQFKPNAGLGIEFSSEMNAMGTPDAPITFEGFNGGPWDGLTYLFIGSGARLDHCRIRNADNAVALIETLIKADNSIFTNNNVAFESGYGAIVRKSQFINNGFGIESPFDVDGTTNPNSFVGNGIAVGGDAGDSAIGNWWGNASGPNATGNPGGSGDTILGPVPFEPFLTAEPDFTNHPPMVRLKESPLPMYVPGQKMIFHWSAEDDDAIVSQRVLFSDFGHYPNRFDVVAENLHPDVRSFEFVIPDVGFDVAGAQQAIRIEAIDSNGQIGWDEQTMFITVANLEGEIEFTTDFNQEFTPGDSLDVTYDITSPLDEFITGTLPTAAMHFDVDSEGLSLGVLALLAEMPDVSTDTARITLTAAGSINRQKWFFSPEFTIRPDSRIGDAAPSIQLTSPSAGTFAGGSVVPLTWTASDDEGIHSFVVMASYDGGRVWHDVTEDLPPTTTSYDWQLPTSTGINDVRVRVIVRDMRFQNTSDTVAISIAPGTFVPGLAGDLNCDGVVSVGDIGAFVLALTDPAGYATQFPACDIDNGDVNGDGVASVSDIGGFVALLTGN